MAAEADESPMMQRRASLAMSDDTDEAPMTRRRSSRRPKTEVSLLRFFPPEDEDDDRIPSKDITPSNTEVVQKEPRLRRSKSLPCVLQDEEAAAVAAAAAAEAELSYAELRTFSVGDLFSKQRVAHPLMSCGSEVSECISFIKADALLDLPTPMPRCQDLPSSAIATPEPYDIVVAISHPWKHQAHPDPLGCKMDIIREHIRTIEDKHRPGCNVLVFLDFLCIPQHPFTLEMAARTEEESERFERALRVMHKVYLHSDYIVHIDMPIQHIPEEGDVYTLSGDELQSASFSQVGPHVQISGMSAQGRLQFPGGKRHLPWGLFDCVLSVDGKKVGSVDEVQEEVYFDGGSFDVARYPFGMLNNAPASSRAWIYLERFIAMVKCAMVEEQYAHRMTLSNSAQITAQVYSGAQILAGVADRQDQLDVVLDSFLEELRHKTFSGASIDACKRQHGLEDAEVIGGLMRELLQSLKAHWETEATRQHMRAKRVWSPVAPH